MHLETNDRFSLTQDPVMLWLLYDKVTVVLLIYAICLSLSVSFSLCIHITGLGLHILLKEKRTSYTRRSLAQELL